MEDESGRRRERVTMYRWVIISYDVTRRKRSVAVRVAEYVFGREVRVPTKTGVKTYRYQGIVMRLSVERIGQSVLMMQEQDADDFHMFLTELGEPHTRLVVYADL